MHIDIQVLYYINIYKIYGIKHIFHSYALVVPLKILMLKICSNGSSENIKGMEHVPNIFMSFDKYLFLEMINILI